MRVLIVDDEEPARQRVRRLLSAHSDVEVVGEARGAKEAVAKVIQLEPDLVFLDIRMPDGNGLDVAASLPDPSPLVVFVTAFDEYALPAFDAAALDYVLKPVEADRILRALIRARKRFADKLPRAMAPEPRQLIISERGKTHVIKLEEVLWLEASDNYVAVHTATKAPLMRRTLGALMSDLGSSFVRVHRSSAVALGKIREVKHKPGGEATVVLAGGLEVACSRQYRSALLELMSAAPET